MWYSNKKLIYGVKDTSEMLTIIDNLNKSNTLRPDYMLGSVDIVNMFPGIDNISGLKAVKSFLDARQDQFPPTACIIEAFKLCLECNNSIFNNKHFLQCDGTAKDPHISCSYSDITFQHFNVKALEYNPATTIGEDLGMIFLLSGHIVLINLIYFLIT